MTIEGDTEVSTYSISGNKLTITDDDGTKKPEAKASGKVLGKPKSMDSYDLNKTPAKFQVLRIFY